MMKKLIQRLILMV